jgi:hypothetical protein
MRGDITMTNPFADIALPEVPKELAYWGLPGKQAMRKLTNNLGDISDSLDVLSRYAGRETALTEFVGQESNASDPAVADYNAELETIGEEETEAEEAKAAELKAIEDKYEAVLAEFEARRDAAENALQDAHPEIFANAPTAEENADAVLAVNLATASIKVDVRKTLESLKSREVKNPETGENITIDSVLGKFNVNVPTGKRRGNAGSGEGGFKPRFSKAVVDGVELDNPRVPAVAKQLGMSRDLFLTKMEESVSRESWVDMETGASINFVITRTILSEDGKSSEEKTNSVLVTKGNAPAVQDDSK